MEYKGITFEVTKRENHFALPRPRGQNAWTWEARVFGELLTATLIATTESEVIECVVRFIDNRGFSTEHLIERSEIEPKALSTESVGAGTIRTPFTETKGARPLSF
jgi:hypothetical protein